MSATPTVTDDRLGPGTLTLGSTDYGVQISNVTLTPSSSSNDGTPTLGVPDPAPDTVITWALKGSAIQDFETEDGFVNYCMDNALAVVPFVWVPRNDGTVEYSGECQIAPVEIGGDVNVQITTDFEFAVIGAPTRAAHVPALAARSTAKSSSKSS
jgi:hypothetical protein